MLKKLVRVSCCLGLLIVAGCGRQVVQPVESKEPFSLDAIVAAYQAALEDGQFATHLEKFLSPEAVPLAANNLMLRDGQSNQQAELAEKPTHALREVTGDEWTRMQTYFDFPTRPSHVLEFTTVQKKGPSTWTKVSPLYLEQQAGGWFVVVGGLKSQPQIEQSFEKEKLAFESDNGLWKQHWELQFERDAKYDYQIRLVEMGTGEPLEVILPSEEIKFDEDRKIIRFHLWPGSAAGVNEQNASGTVTIPYAYQAGRRASSFSFDLPIKQLKAYVPNESPAFEGDLLTLARFTADGEEEGKEFVVQVMRTPR